MMTVERAAELFRNQAGSKFGDWFPAQLAVFDYWQDDKGHEQYGRDKLCVYYPTGKGKSKVMLTCIAIRGYTEVVVVTPPSTFPAWRTDARILGIGITLMSHTTFRMRKHKLSRSVPVIVDEYHLLGGPSKLGFKVMDRMAPGMKAPVIIGSATPNYNDAERVYCIAHVLDPNGNRGGYPSWLYEHCITEPSRFSTIPIVHGFKNYSSAEEFLSQMDGVVYLPDDAPDILQDVDMSRPMPDEFYEYNLDRRRKRIMASQMERSHQERLQQIIGPDGKVYPEVISMLCEIAADTEKSLIVFAMHSKVSKALSETLSEMGTLHAYVDGTQSTANKEQQIQSFKNGTVDLLIGTASMATGTDGLDKVCDVMVILDDTSDDAARRQLVGRILPRGTEDPDYSKKKALRFTYSERKGV